LLAKERACRWVIEAMDDVRHKLGVALWGYVIMPEHVHLIGFPQHPDSCMEHILAALKRPVSRWAKQHLVDSGNTAWLERLTVTEAHRVVFRFWQPGGGYDRNIWHGRSIEEMIAYVHANPVRRGLVSAPLDWPWSSARFWHDRSGPLAMDALEI
jgi:putative transposase